jgi:hypothetical protein
MKNLHLYLIVSTFILVSCGGGGGGGGGSAPTTPTTPAPTVNLSADPTSVLLESTSTLTWSSTNANSCSASWTSQTGTSGSEAVTITTVGDNTFSISCTGAGGSGSASVTVEGYRETDGVVVDGYISGAEVCIDEDESWTCDASENSTTSDNEGKFTIRYANGNLVSIGGTDLDSQTLLDNLLITHKLTGHSEFKAVTPVTSTAAFMEDASLVNAALGIDSSIDVFTFDPVANKGDGGIYDYFYEKGNQLTVLAFALQNITNNLNTTTETTQDYFKAITEEIEKEYTQTETKVDIETETFITKALDNVIAAKSVTIDETAKANTTKALASVLPVIEVKPSDDLTTGVIRFAVSTLQTDIQAIANGTATAETVISYTNDILTYIAEDQNIDADEIAPDISAIADSASTSEDTAVTINVVANDSYLTSAPISVIAGNGTNGITSIAESSPEQITYEPDADYNGTDTFSYTITQGDKTSSADVTVTIEAVNDAPSIDVASTIQVAENQTAVTTVSVSDVDEDELTLTLGGTDADSFNLSDENVLTFKEAADYETKNSYSITLTLTDGAVTVTKDIAISITNTNDAPRLLNEKNIFVDENQINVISLAAQDDDGDDIIISITEQADYADFNLEPFSWNLSFKEDSVPDYETKNTYSLIIKLNDQNEGVVFEEINIVINDINEAPTLWCQGDKGQFNERLSNCYEQKETSTDGIQLNYRDPENDDVEVQISGLDASYFNIDSSSGILTFIEQPDYETKRNYWIDISLNDGQNSRLYKDVRIMIWNEGDEDLIFYTDSLVTDGNYIDIGYIPLLDPDNNGNTYLGNFSYSINNSLGTTDGDLFAIDDNGLLKFKDDPSSFDSLKDLYDLTISVLQGEDLYKFVLKVKIINSEAERVGNSIDVNIRSTRPEKYISDNGNILRINSRDNQYGTGGNDGIFVINDDSWIEYDIAENYSLIDGVSELKGNAIYGVNYERIENKSVPTALYLNLWNGLEFNKSSFELNYDAADTPIYFTPKKDMSSDNSTIAYVISYPDEPKQKVRVIERDSSGSLVNKGNIINLQFPFEDETLSNILETFCRFYSGDTSGLTLDHSGNTLAVLTKCSFNQENFKNFGIDTDRSYSQYTGQYILFFDFEDGLWNQREFFFTPQKNYLIRQDNSITKIKFSKDGKSLFVRSMQSTESIAYANLWNWDGEAWLKSKEIPLSGWRMLINEDFSSLVTYTDNEVTYSEISGNSLNPIFFYKSEKRIWPNTSENGRYLAIEQLVQDDSSENCGSGNICNGSGFIQVFDLDSFTANN